MSITIGEVIENAQSNFDKYVKTGNPLYKSLATAQATNANDLLEQGFKKEDDFDYSKLTVSK